MPLNSNDWLRTQLKTPQPAARVQRAATEAGITRKQLARAKKALRVVVQRRTEAGRVAGWTWRLPPTDAKGRRINFEPPTFAADRQRERAAARERRERERRKHPAGCLCDACVEKLVAREPTPALIAQVEAYLAETYGDERVDDLRRGDLRWEDALQETIAATRNAYAMALASLAPPGDNGEALRAFLGGMVARIGELRRA